MAVVYETGLVGRVAVGTGVVEVRDCAVRMGTRGVFR